MPHLKYIPFNTCNTIWKSYVCKTFTASKRFTANTCNAIGNYYFLYAFKFLLY